MALRYWSKTYTVDGSDSSFFIKNAVITLSNWDGVEEFKLSYGGTETVAFVRGTNATAAAIQTALRTLTGDTALTVAGTTDTGPFTVTFANTFGRPTFQSTDILEVTSTTGNLTGAVTVGIYDVLRDRNTTRDIPDVSNDAQGNTSFSGRWPFLIRRLTSYQTTGAGMTYEWKDLEWGNELADEDPTDVVLTVPHPCNGLTFTGDGFEDGDVVDICMWYESQGDYRF